MTKEFKEHLEFRKQLKKTTLLANLITFAIVAVIIGLDVLRYLWS